MFRRVSRKPRTPNLETNSFPAVLLSNPMAREMALFASARFRFLARSRDFPEDIVTPRIDQIRY